MCWKTPAKRVGVGLASPTSMAVMNVEFRSKSRFTNRTNIEDSDVKWGSRDGQRCVTFFLRTAFERLHVLRVGCARSEHIANGQLQDGVGQHGNKAGSPPAMAYRPTDYICTGPWPCIFHVRSGSFVHRK